MAKDTIKMKKSTLWIIGIVVGVVLLLGVTNGLGLFSNNQVEDTESEDKGTQAEGNEVDLISEGDPILGEKDAPISVVEFSDFECPYCKKASQSTVGGLKNSQMFKNGEINLIYKHFPLSRMHPDAQKAAEASECANNQGEFWEYHDKLFRNQNSLGISSLKQYAKELGLDTEEFNSCLVNGDEEDKVKSDANIGRNAGAKGTPYFIVINKETGETQSASGAIPWQQLKSAIEQVE